MNQYRDIKFTQIHLSIFFHCQYCSRVLKQDGVKTEHTGAWVASSVTIQLLISKSLSQLHMTKTLVFPNNAPRSYRLPEAIWAFILCPSKQQQFSSAQDRWLIMLPRHRPSSTGAAWLYSSGEEKNSNLNLLANRAWWRPLPFARWLTDWLTRSGSISAALADIINHGAVRWLWCFRWRVSNNSTVCPNKNSHKNTYVIGIYSYEQGFEFQASFKRPYFSPKTNHSFVLNKENFTSIIELPKELPN